MSFNTKYSEVGSQTYFWSSKSIPDTFTFTTEDVVGTNEKMRHYDSIEECVEDYANIVYLCHPELKGDNNIWDYDRFLKHYTPNPKEPVVYKYARIIKDYNLEQYDE